MNINVTLPHQQGCIFSPTLLDWHMALRLSCMAFLYLLCAVYPPQELLVTCGSNTLLMSLVQTNMGYEFKIHSPF